MKTILQDLKKGDRFIFNNTTYTVAKRFPHLNYNIEARYLETTDGWRWPYPELIVEKIIIK